MHHLEHIFAVKGTFIQFLHSLDVFDTDGAEGLFPFVFVIRQLSVGDSEPSLLKVFLAEALSPLGTFLNFPLLQDQSILHTAEFFVDVGGNLIKKLFNLFDALLLLE